MKRLFIIFTAFTAVCFLSCEGQSNQGNEMDSVAIDTIILEDTVSVSIDE